MKTLDEVIKAVQHCRLISGFDDSYEYDGGCPYEDCSKCEQKRMFGKDIIHYLKAYKRVQNKIEKIALGNIEDTLDKLDNKSLSWDELKSMEGKPVWVEGKTMDDHDGEYKFWCIVGKTDKLDTYIHLREHGYSHWKNTYGDWWQAYRKERG